MADTQQGEEDYILESSYRAFSPLLVGTIPVNTSIKSVDISIRINIAKRCIRKLSKIGYAPDVLDSAIGSIPNHYGLPVTLFMSARELMVECSRTREVLFKHDLSLVSFAFLGDEDLSNYFCYIVRDYKVGRICLVFEAGNGDRTQALDVMQCIRRCFTLGLNLKKAPACPNPEPPKQWNESPPQVPQRKHSQNPRVDLSHIPVAVSAIPKCGEWLSENEGPADTQTAINGRNNLEPRGHPWYMGLISRPEAEEMLHDDGDFLVRASLKESGQYILSGVHKGKHIHLLLINPDGKVQARDKYFDSIQHLVDYHVLSGFAIRSADNELFLKMPAFKHQLQESII